MSTTQELQKENLMLLETCMDILYASFYLEEGCTLPHEKAEDFRGPMKPLIMRGLVRVCGSGYKLDWPKLEEMKKAEVVNDNT